MKDWNFLFRKFVLGQRPNAEPLVVKKLKKIKGKLFVDIGCNEKFYARLLRKNFDEILTVDPNPKWKADMQIALANFNGEAPFYIGMNNGSADSIIPKPHIMGKDWLNGEPFMVQVRRFDDLAISADLAKIDVEGSEFEVLEGMEGNRPKNLMVELHDERRDYELWFLMGAMGYLVTKIDDTHFFGELMR